MENFVGGMLTFLKPGSDLVGMWRVAKSLFLSMTVSFVLHNRKPYPSHCQNSKQLRDSYIAINAPQLRWQTSDFGINDLSS